MSEGPVGADHGGFAAGTIGGDLNVNISKQIFAKVDRTNEDTHLELQQSFEKYDLRSNTCQIEIVAKVDVHSDELRRSFIYHIVSDDGDCRWAAARLLIDENPCFQHDVRVFRTKPFFTEGKSATRSDLITFVKALNDVSDGGCTLIIDVHQDNALIFRADYDQWPSTQSSITTSVLDGREPTTEADYVIVLMPKVSWDLTFVNAAYTRPPCWEVDYVLPILTRKFDDDQRTTELAGAVRSQFRKDLWPKESDERYREFCGLINRYSSIEAVEAELDKRSGIADSSANRLPTEMKSDGELALMAIFIAAYLPGLGASAFRHLMESLIGSKTIRVKFKKLVDGDDDDGVDDDDDEQESEKGASRKKKKEQLWEDEPLLDSWDIRGDAILAEYGIIAKRGADGSRTISFEDTPSAAGFRQALEEAKPNFVELQLKELVDKGRLSTLEETPESVHTIIEFLWRIAQRDKSRAINAIKYLAGYLYQVIAKHSAEEASFAYLKISGNRESLRDVKEHGRSLDRDLEKRCSEEAVAKLVKLINVEVMGNEDGFTEFLQSVFGHLIAPFGRQKVGNDQEAVKIQQCCRETLRYVCIGLARRIGLGNKDLRLQFWLKRLCAESTNKEVDDLRRLLTDYARTGPAQTHAVIEMTAGWLVEENAANDDDSDKTEEQGEKGATTDAENEKKGDQATEELENEKETEPKNPDEGKTEDDVKAKQDTEKLKKAVDSRVSQEPLDTTDTGDEPEPANDDYAVHGVPARRQLNLYDVCDIDEPLDKLEGVAVGVFYNLIRRIEDGENGKWPPNNPLLANLNSDGDHVREFAEYLVTFLTHESFEKLIAKEFGYIGLVKRLQFQPHNRTSKVFRWEFWYINAMEILRLGVVLCGEGRKPKSAAGQEAWETILAALNDLFEQTPEARRIWRQHIDNWIVAASSIADTDEVIDQNSRSYFIATIRTGRSALRHLRRPSRAIQRKRSA